VEWIIGGGRRDVAQIMYIHVSKHKNYKMKEKEDSYKVIIRKKNLKWKCIIISLEADKAFDKI
jgi:hypothetical protein